LMHAVAKVVFTSLVFLVFTAIIFMFLPMGPLIVDTGPNPYTPGMDEIIARYVFLGLLLLTPAVIAGVCALTGPFKPKLQIPSVPLGLLLGIVLLVGPERLWVDLTTDSFASFLFVACGLWVTALTAIWVAIRWWFRKSGITKILSERARFRMDAFSHLRQEQGIRRGS
jgi:hypothetical protein